MVCARSFLQQKNSSIGALTKVVALAALSLAIVTLSVEISHAATDVASKSNDVTVVRDGKGRLVLSAPCDRIDAEVAALGRWKQRIDRVLPKPGAVIREGAFCRVDIEDGVPEHVAKYNLASAANEGPNCFDAVLVVNRLVPGIRAVTPMEMKAHIESPLCKLIGPGETLEPGDIGEVRMPKPDLVTKDREVHAFIFVTPKLVFSKNGMTNRAPFKLQSPEAALDGQGAVPQSGTWFNEQGVVTNNPCSVQQKNGRNCMEFYRCQTLDEYLAQNEKLLDRDIKVLNDEFSRFECKIGEMSMYGGVVGRDEIKTLFQLFRILRSSLAGLNAKAARDLKHSAPDAAMLKLLGKRLESIQIQLESNIGQTVDR